MGGGQAIQDLPPVAAQVWRNLIATLSLPTTPECVAQWGKARQKEFSVWSRYQKGKMLGGTTCTPPYPREGEELQSLAYDAGIGERCWKYFFVTNTSPVAGLTVTATDLTGPAGKMPASALTVYIQDRPYPDFVKGSHWLVGPEFPVGRFGLLCPSDPVGGFGTV